MIFEDMDRIVFAGDSVTDMGSVNPVGEGLFDNLGNGYVRMIENLLAAKYPQIHLRITNSGVAGNTSRDLLSRWDRDVRALNPQWVSICIGVNDVWRQFDFPAIPDRMVSPEEYHRNVEEMILREKHHVKGIFLMSPYYIEPDPNDFMRKRMDEYGKICSRLAAKHHCIFIDLQAMFTKYCVHRHSSFLAMDRIHPNQIGATLIALEWLKHCSEEFTSLF